MVYGVRVVAVPVHAGGNPRLQIDARVDTRRPCVPASWSGFRIRYRAKKSCYDISVSTTGEREKEETVNSEGVNDGEATIVLADDQQEHQVEVKV